MRSDPQLKKWYKRLNKRYFGGKLPSQVSIYYDEELNAGPRSRKTSYGDAEWGKGRQPVVRINPILREQGFWSVILMTLEHEMVHLEQYRRTGYMNHGPSFEHLMKSLARKGAFSRHNGITKNSVW